MATKTENELVDDRGPLTVACPYCGAPAGQWCYTTARAYVTSGTAARIHKIRRLGEFTFEKVVE
jgi:hypothetical protein